VGDLKIGHFKTENQENPRVGRGESAAPEGKSPPFAEEREGWGTLKFKCGSAVLERNPRAQSGETVPQGCEQHGAAILEDYKSLLRQTEEPCT